MPPTVTVFPPISICTAACFPYAQAVVVNAGIANACTGKQGYECCRQTAEKAAEALGVPLDAVLVAFTSSLSASCKSSLEIARSVVIKPNMVLIFG